MPAQCCFQFKLVLVACCFAMMSFGQTAPHAHVTTWLEWSTTTVSSRTVSVHDGDWVEVHLSCHEFDGWLCGGMASYYPPGTDTQVLFDRLFRPPADDHKPIRFMAFGTQVHFTGRMQVLVPVIYKGAYYAVSLAVVSTAE